MSFISNDILFTIICIILPKAVPPLPSPPPPSPPLQLNFAHGYIATVKLIYASVISNHSVEAEHAE